MRKYPIALIGVGIKRWEKLKDDRQWKNQPLEEYWDKSGLIFWVDRSKQGWGPTHIQYKSHFGFLITWPFCFHFWIQPKFRVGGVEDTEWVFYWRFGWARWEGGSGKYIAPTWYGPGLHWD